MCSTTTTTLSHTSVLTLFFPAPILGIFTYIRRSIKPAIYFVHVLLELISGGSASEAKDDASADTSPLLFVIYSLEKSKDSVKRLKSYASTTSVDVIVLKTKSVKMWFRHFGGVSLSFQFNNSTMHQYQYVLYSYNLHILFSVSIYLFIYIGRIDAMFFLHTNTHTHLFSLFFPVFISYIFRACIIFSFINVRVAMCHSIFERKKCIM